MDEHLDNNQIFHTAKNDKKVTCIDIIQNILNANADNISETVEKRLLNTKNVDPTSPPDPRNGVETPKRTKRRRESEPTALDRGHNFPGSETSSNWDHTPTEQITFPQSKILRSAPANIEEANETTRSKITTQLKPNLQKRTATGEKPFKCSHCDYRTNRSKYLQEHDRTHTGERPYKCDHCDYRARQSYALRRHVRTHTGEKPHKCGYCNYRTSTISYLQQHERTHTGEKPHKCGYCNYRAIQISNLKQHEKTHTGEKPYICSHCDYRAIDRSHMRVHERTHTGEKPFKCDQCNYRTTSSSHLRRHVKTHTGERPYQCSTDCAVS